MANLLTITGVAVAVCAAADNTDAGLAVQAAGVLLACLAQLHGLLSAKL